MRTILNPRDSETILRVPHTHTQKLPIVQFLTEAKSVSLQLQFTVIWRD